MSTSSSARTPGPARSLDAQRRLQHRRGLPARRRLGASQPVPARRARCASPRSPAPQEQNLARPLPPQQLGQARPGAAAPVRGRARAISRPSRAIRRGSTAWSAANRRRSGRSAGPMPMAPRSSPPTRTADGIAADLALRRLFHRRADRPDRLRPLEQPARSDQAASACSPGSIPRPRFAQRRRLLHPQPDRRQRLLSGRREFRHRRPGPLRLDLRHRARRPRAVAAASMRAAAARCAASASRSWARESAEPRLRSADPDETATIAVPLGGRSLVEFAVEGRYRFGNYGVVAFVDAGQVYESAISDLLIDMRFGVGVGGRVYTNFGPVRVDVATPIGRRAGRSADHRLRLDRAGLLMADGGRSSSAAASRARTVAKWAGIVLLGIVVAARRLPALAEHRSGPPLRRQPDQRVRDRLGPQDPCRPDRRLGVRRADACTTSRSPTRKGTFFRAPDGRARLPAVRLFPQPYRHPRARHPEARLSRLPRAAARRSRTRRCSPTSTSTSAGSRIGRLLIDPAVTGRRHLLSARQPGQDRRRAAPRSALDAGTIAAPGFAGGDRLRAAARRGAGGEPARHRPRRARARATASSPA